MAVPKERTRKTVTEKKEKKAGDTLGMFVLPQNIEVVQLLVTFFSLYRFTV